MAKEDEITSGDDLGASFSEQFAETHIEGEDTVELETEIDIEDVEREEGEAAAEENSENNQDSQESKDKAAADKTAADKLAKEKETKEKLDKLSAEDKKKYDALATDAEKEKFLTDNKSASQQQQQAQVKPFEEELLARFDGKYKSMAELTQALEKPAQEVEKFASPFIEHLNKLEKAGVKIDQDFVNELTMPYETMENPVQILMEDLRRSDPKYKTWSNEELEAEVRFKYQMHAWAPEGEEANEIEKIYSTRQLKDAEEAVEKLIAKREALKNVPVVDPKIAEQVAKDKLLKQQTYEGYIDKEVISKLDKIDIQLNDKESVSYVPEPAELAEVGKTLKAMGENPNALFKQFFDDKGKFDYKGLSEMILWTKIRGKAIKLAHEQGKAAGGEAEHRNLSNTNMEAKENKNNAAANDTLDGAIQESLQKNL